MVAYDDDDWSVSWTARGPLAEIAEAAALLNAHADLEIILPTQLALIQSAVKTLRLAVKIGDVPEGEVQP